MPCGQGPLWAAVLNVAGELYQAFLDSRALSLIPKCGCALGRGRYGRRC